MQNETLRYRNPEFAIHHLIDDCPPFTVVRELVKNAEESASMLTPPGAVSWFVEVVDGVPKIGIYNEGPSMSGEQLSSLMDLASSGKTLGVENNYGQGGKISALKVSPHGVIYRSCKGGQVCQVILAAERSPRFDFPVYVKKRQLAVDANGDESLQVVIDVTDSTYRPLDREWTEVVLLGRDAKHNTVAELLPGIGSNNWLMRLINRRFYRFAPGLSVAFANITTGQPNARNAVGLEESTKRWTEMSDDVVAEHPTLGVVKIRYCKLKGRYGVDREGHSRAQTLGGAYGIGTRGDHICIVWKNECYDIKIGGNEWTRISGQFGCTFGSQNIAIHIQLPETAPVKNNTYRDCIIERENDHQQVEVEHFAEVVKANRPQWLIDYVESEGSSSTDGSELMDRLKEFMDYMRSPGGCRKQVDEGAGNCEGDAPARSRSQGGGGVNPKPAPDPNGSRTRPVVGKPLASQTVGIPQIDFTNDVGIQEAMSGRAAVYKPEINSVLLNPKHWKYQEDLQKVLDEEGPDTGRQQLAKGIFDKEYRFNAGKYVILAWIYRGKPEWQDSDWERALCAESITIMLTSPETVESTRKKLRKR